MGVIQLWRIVPQFQHRAFGHEATRCMQQITPIKMCASKIVSMKLWQFGSNALIWRSRLRCRDRRSRNQLPPVSLFARTTIAVDEAGGCDTIQWLLYSQSGTRSAILTATAKFGTPGKSRPAIFVFSVQNLRSGFTAVMLKLNKPLQWNRRASPITFGSHPSHRFWTPPQARPRSGVST